MLSEKDPERFVRASAVRILHWKLEICVECNFGEAMSDEMVSQKNNLKNVVLVSLYYNITYVRFVIRKLRQVSTYT